MAASTDVFSFGQLDPKADVFRNYFSSTSGLSRTTAMNDRAILLGLTVPEVTVLVGGLRALNANAAQCKHGVFTAKPGTFTNDFFVYLLDLSTEWEKSTTVAGLYEGADRKTGARAMSAPSLTRLSSWSMA